jgi:hypothetical protein
METYCGAFYVVRFYGLAAYLELDSPELPQGRSYGVAYLVFVFVRVSCSFPLVATTASRYEVLAV